VEYRHRGAGASIGRDGSVRSVRENTMLSFQKAAVNHSDFIEFDVHVTADAQVVVHHDFDVKLAVGRETISLGIPALTYAQLSTYTPPPFPTPRTLASSPGFCAPVFIASHQSSSQ
jgi:glycerophosphoryl diester phosphodiesterase